jgi:plastocyanin
MKHFFTSTLLAASFLCSGAAFAQDEKAEIKLFQFQPKEIIIKKNDTVTWTNSDDIEHSVTAGTPEKETGAFDSGYFTKGKTFTQKFEEEAFHDYYCKRHPSMKGKIVVTQ